MGDKSAKKSRLKSFPPTYWLSIVFEFFERGSYYGMMSILAVYMTDYLRFSEEQFGIINGTVVPILIYGLPLITGAIADRMGYKKTLMVAFSMLGMGYFLLSQMDGYAMVFMAMVVLGFGAGFFKPVISGTIAKVTDERTSTLGFGIFYWTINLGAFLFPLVLVPLLKEWDPVLRAFDSTWVFVASAIGTGGMLIPTLLIYKEPTREKTAKEPLSQTIIGIFKKVGSVFADIPVISFIFIYSWFWVLYFQMFGTVLWYVRDFVDATVLNNFVNNVFGQNWMQNLIGFTWHFDVEHVTVINAGTIILLQLVVSSIVKKTKALPTMITGIGLGTLGMAILAVNTNIWVFMAGIMIFSIGEMTAHPKFISYLGLIAPPDKKATYMGFGFLYGVFGSFFGNMIGPWLYVDFINNPMIAYIREKGVQLADNVVIKDALETAVNAGLSKDAILAQANPSGLWLLFCGIGVVCIAGLLTYGKFVGTREAAK